jgi:coenzyme F420-reducing hydrogenase alpha subunit
MSSKGKSRTIKVDYLARVEGEGALYVKVRDDAVEDVKLKIFEPPRFFEAFLRGRKFTEAPDITARICGICPIAYQSSSISAMEEICGITVEKPIRELRRLMYCSEWIESHVLHIAMLHAPDFLGYQDAIEMAQDHPDIVKTALRLKKLGNTVMDEVGGRAIHPINMRVGGFYRVPTKQELLTQRDELLWARDAALALVKWTTTLDIPDFERDYEFVAMQHPDEYPLWEGRLVSNKGLDIPISEFYEHIREEQVSHSTSYHSVLMERGAYHVGPNARYSLNFDKLSPLAQESAREAGLGTTCLNPFMSIVVRAVETVYALDESLRIIEEYEMPDSPYVEAEPRAGRGHGCSEAPRGICYHTYEIDDNGIITDAHIAPPTAQNQRTIEEDLLEFVPGYLDLSQEDLTWKCEQAVRNYDPCISCSCHFLKLELDRA